MHFFFYCLFLQIGGGGIFYLEKAFHSSQGLHSINRNQNMVSV